MKIKEAAQNVGVVTETLRVWERHGIIPPVERTALGQRIYSAEDILRIQRIIKEKREKR